MKKGFKPGSLDPTLSTKAYDDELFVCQIYVDDIIFGCTNQRYSDEFAYMMSEEYQMSIMGELKFFLGLQIRQQYNGIFKSQEKVPQGCVEEIRHARLQRRQNPNAHKWPSMH